MAAAVFSTLKSECLPATQVFESKAVARRELFEYIEIYYNNQRLHSALGYQALGDSRRCISKKKINFSKKMLQRLLFRSVTKFKDSKRNKWKGPSGSVGSSPFMPDVYEASTR